MSPRIAQFKDLARQARRDLFDQSHPIGRLSLVQCVMLGGDTLITISLAGSLFFSISPKAADHQVLLYLLFTLAPFAIVSPLLGPLIDRSRGARRIMVVSSAVGRAVLCPLMALHIHSFLLFPLAFCVLVCSKLYLVTKGALVPEMAALDRPEEREAGYATLNARLTLLGTLAGFAASVPGVILYKLGSSPAVLVLATMVFVVAAVAGTRLPVISGRPADRLWGDGPRQVREYGQAGEAQAREEDLRRLQPIANPEVMLGLTAMCIVRGLTGFMTFMLAFGLRRIPGVGLWWYGLVLAGSGAGAIVGLVLVGRLRKRMTEQQLLLCALWLISLVALGCALWGTLFAQVVLAFTVGLCGAVAQPSFDAMTQRYIPLSAQGRAFARFGMRQQLIWVVGSLIPVIVAFTLPQGDATMAILAAIGGVTYVSGRRASRTSRALPRDYRELGGIGEMGEAGG
ncbi:MAG TPA: MFS transporter [Acidimicrobiales bacterium]|nr:MFS transporter [Acidimicrobiales bacterium]